MPKEADVALRRTNVGFSFPFPVRASPCVPDKARTVENRCKAVFESDAAIRAEFGALGAFTAYQRALEQGRLART